MINTFPRLGVLFFIFCFCAASAFAGSVSISSPANNSTVSSSVRVTASATSSSTVNLMQIYVDGSKKYETSGAKLDTTLSLPSGGHKITVQARDSAGSWFKNSVGVTVSSTPTVTISSPTQGSSSSSPVSVSASASSPHGAVNLMQAYVDGVKKYETSGDKLATSLSLSTGDHRLTVQARDSAGNWFKDSVNFKVSSTSSSTDDSSTSTAKTFWNIDELAGWESCSACAGSGGNGPIAVYSMKRGIANPSIDGKAAEFFLGGNEPYANALWWKQLGGHDAASNFVFEMRYYIKDPAASQALEFDVNQTRKAEGKWYIFGTECDFKDKKVWKVYDPSIRKWIPTTIACSVPKAYTWHHIVLEFKRTANAGTTFVAVTINGVKHYFNKTYPARAADSSTLNVAFQMDGNKYQTDYRVWVDKMTLKIW